MPPLDSADDEQQMRNNIARILRRANIPADDARVGSLARALTSAELAAEGVARAVRGDRGPAAFRAPKARPDA